MKTKLLTAIACGVLLSCQPNRAEQGPAGLSEEAKKLETAVPFAGIWVSEDYFNSLQKLKSPKLAQEGSEYYEIPEQTLQPAMIGFNFHEGGPNLTVVKNGGQYQVWEVMDDSITQKWGDVEIVSPANIKIDGRSLVKIIPEEGVIGRLILEEILFKGHYTTNDGSSVVFKNNGEVTGMDGVNYYSPVIDYIGPGMEVDQIGLGATVDDLQWYGFKFDNNELKLYELKCITYESQDSTCLEVELGKLLYQFAKKE